MARNEEKAMAALNRWTAQKRDIEKMNNLGKSTYMGGALPGSAQFGPYAAKKRPKIASECTTVKECEHWRSEILSGVAKKIAEIQNAALGEHRIRDLNDEINKDLREKNYWEDQIKALGGADHKANASKDVDVYGAELASHSGYKYFGAAKDLPGVRDIFESEPAPEAPRKTRKQLFLHIQPDYYGWRDEEDGMMLIAEQQAEHEAVQREAKRFKAAQAKRPAGEAQDTATEAPATTPAATKDGDIAPVAEASEAAAAKKTDFKAYVDVPTMQDIERLILEKKKKHLLARYVSKDGQAKTSETNSMLTVDDKKTSE